MPILREKSQDLHLSLGTGTGDNVPRRRRIRADRKEACYRVAHALMANPLASVQDLTKLAWPEAQWDGKRLKALYQRTRRALIDLRQSLGRDELLPVLQEALAVREAAERRGKRRKTFGGKRDADRNLVEVLKKQPVRRVLRRLLAFPEIREEISRAVRQLRHSRTSLEAEEQAMWWAFPLRESELMISKTIPHFAPGLAGMVPNKSEAKQKVQTELSLIRQIRNVPSVNVDLAASALQTAKALRRAVRRNDYAVEVALRAKLRQCVFQALETAGWADPDLSAGQILETPEERKERETAAWIEVKEWLVRVDMDDCSEE